MKYTTALLALATLLATTTLASPSPSPSALLPRWHWNYCKWRGQSCSEKLKRTIDDAGAHLHTPDAVETSNDFLDHICSLPDKPCYAAKRSAETLAGALAEAHAFVSPEKRWQWNYCKWRGQSCSEKLKRAADGILSEFGDEEPEFAEDGSDEEHEMAEEFKAITERLRAAAKEYQTL